MVSKLRSLTLLLGALMVLTVPAVAQRVPDWMVGRFEGYSRRDNQNITLRINSQGAITPIDRSSGRYADRLNVSFRRDILTIGDRNYTVQRTADGFRAIPTNDVNYRNDDRYNDSSDRYNRSRERANQTGNRGNEINFRRIGDASDTAGIDRYGNGSYGRNGAGSSDRYGNGNYDRSGSIDQRVPDWMIGRFEGTRRDGRTITLWGNAQGDLTVSNRGAGQTLTRAPATYRRGYLTIDNRIYRVEETENGFRAMPSNGRNAQEFDRNDLINFRRVGDNLSAHRTGDRYGTTDLRVPDWMVGRFEGYSRRDGQTITLRINRQGNMSVLNRAAAQNGDRLTASYRRDILTIEDRDYTIQRTTDGFRAIPTDDRYSQSNDRNYQINFRRIGD